MTEINRTPETDVQALAEHAAEIRRLGKRVIGDILEIGRRLGEVKKQLGRADFLPWIEREFGWSEDTAERFIALHALQRSLPQLAETNLPVSALYLLAKPSTPPEAIQAVVAQAEAGEHVTVAGVKEAIEAHKPPKPKPEQKESTKAVGNDVDNDASAEKAKQQQAVAEAQPAGNAQSDEVPPKPQSKAAAEREEYARRRAGLAAAVEIIVTSLPTEKLRTLAEHCHASVMLEALSVEIEKWLDDHNDEPPPSGPNGGEPAPVAREPSKPKPAAETVSQAAPQPVPFIPAKPAPQQPPPAQPPGGPGPRLSGRTKVTSHYLPAHRDPWPKDWRRLSTSELEDAIEATQRFGINHRLEDRHHKELAKMRERLKVLRKADNAQRRSVGTAQTTGAPI
jgi:hypothetical protein